MTTGEPLVAPDIIRAIKPANIQDNIAMIGAEVSDDQNVDDVWAVVYPPSYVPPANRGELVAAEDMDIIYLNNTRGNVYEGRYRNFTEEGTYRIIIHADDDDRLVAEPEVMEIEVRNTTLNIYLPFVSQ